MQPRQTARSGVIHAIRALILISLLVGCGPVAAPTTVPVPATAVQHPPTVPRQEVSPAVSPTPPVPPPPSATTAPPRPTPPPTIPPSATVAVMTATPGPFPQVPILTYHHLDVPQAGEYNVTVAQFTRQMAWLADEGYQTITPAALLAAAAGTGILPPHPVLITFDDNYREPYDLAVPILKKHGFTATFFIMTVTIGKRFFMTADEIRSLDRAGFTIGGHTWDHPLMTHLSADQLQQELDQSTADLTAVLGHRPVDFAYPDGVYNAQVVAAVQAAGYRAAFRLFNRDDPVVDPRYMIRRQDIAGPWSLHDFINNVHWMEP